MIAKRNLLYYFLDSNVWLTYEWQCANNINYWWDIDMDRAKKVQQGYYTGDEGHSVAERINDMIECVIESNLKPATKKRLYQELDELEQYHMDKGTLEVEL